MGRGPAERTHCFNTLCVFLTHYYALNGLCVSSHPFPAPPSHRGCVDGIGEVIRFGGGHEVGGPPEEISGFLGEGRGA